MHVTVEAFEKCAELVTRALPYIKQAHDDARARHDEIGGDLYMDLSRFEIMCDTEEWMRSREELFDGNPL